MSAPMTDCPIIPSPTQYEQGSDGTTFRAMLNQSQFTAVGKWLSVRFMWPDDNLDGSISSFTPFVIPVTPGS